MAASLYCIIQSYMLVCIQSVAFQGAEVVFHMAAPNSSINNYQLHHSVNVEGTQSKCCFFALSFLFSLEFGLLGFMQCSMLNALQELRM